MRIVLLEDNPVQSETMLQELRRRLHLAENDLLFIRTESEFRFRMDEIGRFRPDVAVLDVMVMWSVPSPDAPERPPEVKEQGYYVAGVRCAEVLRTRLPRVPIVFFTIVEPVELAAYLEGNAKSVTGAVIVPKGPDLGIVCDKIRELVSGHGAG